MNAKIREMQDELIDVVNKYDLPIEVKRLLLSYVLQLVKPQADSAVYNELSNGEEEGKDAEKLPEN